MKFLKDLFLKLSITTIKSLGKNNTSKNYLIKKFTSSFNLIILNATNLSNSFHGQIFLKNTIFVILKSEVELSLIGLRNALVNI